MPEASKYFGEVFWLYGLSGAGKTTLASAIGHSDPHVRTTFLQWRQMRVVEPEVRTFATHVGLVTARITQMQVAHGGGEHGHVAGRLVVEKNEL